MNTTIDLFTQLALQKSQLLKNSPLAFMTGSLMAGAYVGIGIILILTVATPLDPSLQKLVLGVCFGIALTLVVIAGAELFTGYTLYMTLGILYQQSTYTDLTKTWFCSWIGNLLGSVSLVLLYLIASGPLLSDNSLLMKIASYKVNAEWYQLIAKGILCNWLVCLAIWMSKRVDSDAARCIVIFWCLFAFIAAGFEHSVANMTLLALAYVSDTSGNISVFDVVNNLTWVTIGNIIGGSLFVAKAYSMYSGPCKRE